MRETILSLLVLMLTLASCQLHTKYNDKDIRKLIEDNTEAIQKNKAAIDSLQMVLNAGSYITKVTTFQDGTGGIAIYTSKDSAPYKIYNGATGEIGETGASGTPAVLWTIGSDGLWYKDGVLTPYPANGQAGAAGQKGDAGEKGDKGDAGIDGTNGKNGAYYVPNQETGYFDIYQDGQKESASNVKWRDDNQHLTAMVSNGVLTIAGVDGDINKTIQLTLAKVTAIALDDTDVDEIQSGFPAIMFKENADHLYEATVKYKVTPAVASLTVDDVYLLSKTLATRAQDYPKMADDGFSYSNGVLTLKVLYDSLPIDKLNLFAVRFGKDGNQVVSNYATGFVTQGFAKRGITATVNIKWVQLWAGGPRFTATRIYAPLTPTMVKFNWGYNGGSYYSGTEYDANGNLPIMYDIAYTYWGIGWRMPTLQEAQGIIDHCTYTYETNYNGETGVNGFVIKGKDKYKDNSIFLQSETTENSDQFWTSTPQKPEYAYTLRLWKDGREPSFIAYKRDQPQLTFAVLNQ